MILSKALSTLGLDKEFTKSELKKAYKAAASKAHADKGGSHEAMLDVASAYAALKNYTGMTSPEQKNNEQVRRELSVVIRDTLTNLFDPEAFTKHFSTLFGEAFTFEQTGITPTDEEIVEMENKPHGASPYYTNISAEWANKDRSRVFQILFSVYITDALNQSKALGGFDTTYNMAVSTFAYIDSRKVKITKRDYTRTAQVEALTTPEATFPKAKVLKKKKAAFKKSDMISALKAELEAKQNGSDYFYLPLQDDCVLIMFRTTFARQGAWSLHDIKQKKGKFSYAKIDGVSTHFLTLPETEETLDLFRAIKGTTAKEAADMINAKQAEIKAKLDKAS